DRDIRHAEILAEGRHETERRGPDRGAPFGLPQRRENVTLTVAVVFCWPGTIGVEESAVGEAARYIGSGEAELPSTIVVSEPSERPEAFASASALSRAASTAFASACR